MQFTDKQLEEVVADAVLKYYREKVAKLKSERDALRAELDALKDKCEEPCDCGVGPRIDLDDWKPEAKPKRVVVVNPAFDGWEPPR